MAITIEIGGADALQVALDTLAAATESEPLADEAGALLFSRVVTRFRDQVSADGTSWAPLKPKTIQQRIRLGFGPSPILYRTGTLLNNLQLVSDGPGARSVTNADPRAGILNSGGTAGNGAIIPARSFMDTNQEDANLMFSLVVNRISQAFGDLA